MLYSHFLRNIFLYTNLFAIEAYLVGACTYITIVSVCHLARTIHYTAHDANLQALHMRRCSLNLGNCRAQVV